MDYIGLFKAGKVIWKTLGESRNVIFVTKKVAKPAAEFVAASLVGVIIEDAIDKMRRKYNG